MKFEHLIEINSPGDPRIEMISRKQLWDGLVLRAETPRLFLPQLDACDILERLEDSLARRLRFGNLIVHDHVYFIEEHQIRFHIPTQNDIVESSLEITIEEPQRDHLFVRFAYQDATPDDDPDAAYNDYRRSAYYEADLDTIRIIRRLTAQALN